MDHIKWRTTWEIGKVSGGGLETLDGKIRSIFCVVLKGPSLGQLGPDRPGPVRLSRQHVAAPRGSRCAADGGMACCEVPAIFFLQVKFQQQHDCIISSTDITEQGSVSLQHLCSFLFDLFFFIKEQRQTYSGDVCEETSLETTTQRTEHWSQTAHRRDSPGPGDAASATSLSSLTLNIKCFFSIVFVRAHIGRQVFSQLHNEPSTLLYMDM